MRCDAMRDVFIPATATSTTLMSRTTTTTTTTAAATTSVSSTIHNFYLPIYHIMRDIPREKVTSSDGGTQQNDPKKRTYIAQTNIAKVPANQKAREKAKIKEHQPHQGNRNGRVRLWILNTTHSITVIVWQTSSQHQKNYVP